MNNNKLALNKIIHKIVQEFPVVPGASFILICLFLLFETAVVKTFMLNHSGSYENLFDTFRVISADTRFLLIAYLVVLGLFFLSRKTAQLQKVILYFFVILSFIFSLCLVAQAVLFKVTGWGLTREYLQNFISYPADGLRMIFAETRWYYWLLMVLTLSFLFWLIRLPQSRWLKKVFASLSQYFKLGLKEVSLVVVSGLLIFLEVIGAVPSQELVHPAIKQIPFLELVEGLRPETDKKEKDNFALLPEEVIGQPIVLTPTKKFKPRNVVLIIFESLSWKYCDVYKPGLGATPFLAELAKKSLVVERLYTVDPHTTKALVTIIGGIYPYPEPEVMEVKPGILPRKSLANLLQQFGYRTAFFQTANDYESRPELVSNLGYETFCGLYHMPREGFAYVNYFGCEEMMMLQPSMKWVEENKGQPFFLTYLTLSTHHEYGYPPAFPARDFNIDNENQNRYLNAVRYTDFFIRKVFEEFKKRGLIENTIFIILGDHGEAFGEHGTTGHNYSLWEEGIRVPGIIYAPGIFKHPGKIEGFWSILDITPTICDLLGLEASEGEFIGRSILRPPDEKREFFLTGWTRSRVMAYRQGRYKFIFKFWERNPEIYDNLVDEDDRHDLWASRPELASQTEDIRKRLERKWKAVAFQYGQWVEEAENKSGLDKPEDFYYRLEAKFENIISLYGYGYFPDKTEPGRTVYVKAGMSSLDRLKRPWKLQAVLVSAQTGRQVEFSLKPRKELERLKAGEYTSAESILVIPADWPTGVSRLFLGMLDEKRNEYLRPEGEGIKPIPGFENLVYAGDLNIFPGDD